MSKVLEHVAHQEGVQIVNTLFVKLLNIISLWENAN